MSITQNTTQITTPPDIVRRINSMILTLAPNLHSSFFYSTTFLEKCNLWKELHHRRNRRDFPFKDKNTTVTNIVIFADLFLWNDTHKGHAYWANVEAKIQSLLNKSPSEYQGVVDCAPYTCGIEDDIELSLEEIVHWCLLEILPNFVNSKFMCYAVQVEKSSLLIEMEEHFSRLSNMPSSSDAYCLDEAFVWSDSVHGSEYWGQVLNRISLAADTVDTPETEVYTGGSSPYYKLQIDNPMTLEDPYEAECGDIIEALDMSFAEGNVFKALWRMCAARKFGNKKKGYDDGLYDAEKIVFFAERIMQKAKEKSNDT